MKVKKAYTRNQYNQVSRLTRDTIWENDKNTRKHHTQESQEVMPFLADYHKAERNRQYSTIKTNVKHKWQNGSKKEAPPWNSQ